MRIETIIANGYKFVVGARTPIGSGIVNKILKENDNHYVVILSEKQEVDVISDNAIVLISI